MNKNPLRVSSSLYIWQYKYYSQWVKIKINRKNNFQGRRQSTVSAAHPGMGQIPTVRWTQQHFENNHHDYDDDDNHDDDDKNDDGGLLAYSHHDKVMMMRLY